MESSPNPFTLGNAAALGGFLKLYVQPGGNGDLEPLTHVGKLTYFLP